MYEELIRERITQLRIAKKISERQMSLELGHNTSYIRDITSGRALPSMGEFLYICEYLGVTPEEIFHTEDNPSSVRQKAVDLIYSMPEENVELLVKLMEKMEK